MKKRILLIALFLSVVTLALVCCDRLPEATLAVRSPYDKQALTISAEELQKQDFTFTRYFSLTGEDGTRYPVLEKYLDVSHFSETEGGYVLCTYKNSTAQLNVNISHVSYELFLDAPSVTVPTLQAEDYDYLSHFYATTDGEYSKITKSMTESTVKAQQGEYYFRVNFHGEIKTLVVYVEDEISLSATDKSIQIDDSQLYTYDFTKLFKLQINGKTVDVTMEDIDVSAIANGVSGTVYCIKGKAVASVEVNVIRNMYQITLKTDSVTLHTSQVENYDFLSLFSATKNGQPFTLTEAMASSNVKNVKGKYEYSITVIGETKTLKVIVTDVHQVEVVVNYVDYKLQIGKCGEFDFKTLFTLYVDGRAKEITDDMIDSSSITNSVAVGDVCEIMLTYDNDGTNIIGKTSVTIVEDVAIRIETSDVVTYPNSKPIDLTTLFAVYEGERKIPVTASMLSVPSNYPIIGVNTITLSYGGVTETATVTVKRGVIINVVSDEIVILKGTNQQNYFFQDDFEVIVNGIEIENILPYIDVSTVNFNAVGEYAVKVSVPYNDKAITGVAGSANLTYYEETIIYKVVANTYTLTLKQDTVQINVGDKFNVGSNIDLTINGFAQSITTNPDLANILNCYAKIVKNVDSEQYGLQQVIFDLYINGIDDADPVRVTYNVEVLSDAVISVQDRVVFTGSTLYTKNLFTITRNGKSVPVTQDMVSGYVNTFKTGIYQVELSFEGITRVATVVVLDNSLVGTYITPMHTVAIAAEYDDDGDKFKDEEPAKQYGPMVILADGTITIDGKNAEILSVVNENELILQANGFVFTAFIRDGIITLIPDNSLMLTYNNHKRPLAYFNSDVWAINRNNNHFVINSGVSYNHIMESQSVGYYTVEVLRLYNKKTFDNLTYAIKIVLAYRNGAFSGDVLYDVSFGEAALNDGFQQGIFEKGVLNFNGNNYKFTFSTDSTIARIDDEEVNNLYLGMTFTDGKSTLAIDSDGGITYAPVGGQTIRISAMGKSQTKNIVYDFDNNTISVYEVDTPLVPTQNWLSYKFVLNLDNSTFTVVEKDKLYGLYFDDNNKYYIFLDGYGGGHASTNLTSYNVTQLTYEQYGNEVELAFQQVTPNFKFGNGMTFYLAEMYNVLTCKTCDYDDVVGVEFVNKHISYGAVIRFDASVWRKLENANKDDLYDLITIITKDGELSLEQKQAAVNLRAVDTNQNGIYQVRINLTLDDTTFSAYYATQVVVPISPLPALAGKYGCGVKYSNYNLTVDEFGLAVIVIDNVTVTGNVDYRQDGFTVIGRFNGEPYNLTATVVSDGIILVESYGSVNFSDYFTVGTKLTASNGVSALTKLTVNNVDTFIWLASTTERPQKIEIAELSDGALQFTTNNGDVFVKVREWNSVGLIVSDGLRGEYVNDSDVLTLDGFGNALINGGNATYTVNANKSVTVISAANLLVAYVDVKTGKYTLSNIALNNTLVQGKTYTAGYIFLCGNASCWATTTIAFDAEGKAVISSVSNDHDDLCENHSEYSAPFASENATYSVSGNIVTLTVNGYEIRLLIADVTTSAQLNVISTTVETDAMGYFDTDTIFTMA